MLIIDDVITAGTAIRESMAIIEAAGARPAGVLIALDRQERGKGDLSAIQEVEQNYGIPVISIIRLEQVLSIFRARGICRPCRRHRSLPGSIRRLTLHQPPAWYVSHHFSGV